MHQIHASESCIWVMHLSHAFVSCIWFMHRIHASESCIWFMHLSHAFDSCIWFMHRIYASDLCVWFKYVTHAMHHYLDRSACKCWSMSRAWTVKKEIFMRNVHWWVVAPPQSCRMAVSPHPRYNLKTSSSRTGKLRSNCENHYDPIVKIAVIKMWWLLRSNWDNPFDQNVIIVVIKMW